MFDPSNMTYLHCRHSIFDNTICIDSYPSQTNPKLYKHNLQSIIIKRNSNCILLFKLIVNPTISPPIRTHQTLPYNRILYIINYPLMPDTEPSLAINDQQVVIPVMLGWDDLYPADICMKMISIYE